MSPASSFVFVRSWCRVYRAPRFPPSRETGSRLDEWCVDTAAIDVPGMAIYANNEDSHHLKCWDLTSDKLSDSRLTVPGGLPIAPTPIGPEDKVYAIAAGALPGAGFIAIPAPTTWGLVRVALAKFSRRASRTIPAFQDRKILNRILRFSAFPQASWMR